MTARLKKAWLRELPAQVGRQNLVNLAGDVRNDPDPRPDDGSCQGLRDCPAKQDLHRQLTHAESLLLDGFVDQGNFLPANLAFAIGFHNHKPTCEVERRREPVVPNRKANNRVHAI
jgi:hypothetical protein